jgi:hypothetical protein
VRLESLLVWALFWPAVFAARVALTIGEAVLVRRGE